MATTPKERPLLERFESAVTVIRSLPKDGAFQPSDMVKLKFYGLYKQSREGPNTTAKPGFWDPTARAKWESWTLCGNMTKEQSMNMYIRELEQIIETMPQSEVVEQFMKAIGPFYEFVDDEESKEDEDEEEEEEEVTKPRKRVTFDHQSPSDDDKEGSEGDLEYEDSYDNLPSTTPPRPSQPANEQRPTPFIHKEAIPLGQPVDNLSTNLFPSPSRIPEDTRIATGTHTEQELTSNPQLTQLLYNIQVLNQRLTRFLDQNSAAQSSSWRSHKRLVFLAIGPLLINVICRYWGTRYGEWSGWIWLAMSICHVLLNTSIICYY